MSERRVVNETLSPLERRGVVRVHLADHLPGFTPRCPLAPGDGGRRAALVRLRRRSGATGRARPGEPAVPHAAGQPAHRVRT